MSSNRLEKLRNKVDALRLSTLRELITVLIHTFLFCLIERFSLDRRGS